MRRNATKTFTLAATLALLTLPAFGAEIEVKMLNKGSDGQAMVFEPAAVKVQPGDTIKFVAVDKGHDVVSMPGLVPEGVAPIKGKISEDVSFTADKPGAYVFKCTPHYGMGMVALVVVGDAPANIDAVKATKMPKKAKERLEAEIAKLGL
ncbi:pseudoazurin [Neorhizobium sp. Rsf11]|uniref:Pseudoazurin n=2 Tax=Neorhizobium TaxID=1525371 RepID=A0ABV0LZT6_9HYPH|nr:pseudoazurin [Neorhizobium petrolearium]MCC2610732.1 pseudoazurin [Neorhizobium petrolearium]WGI70858.1 pseudoazurin [Neorhizobium petrolearium]